MKVPFTPELEARLTHSAAEKGRKPDAQAEPTGLF